MWRLASRGFSWYIHSGFSRYEFVYGSLNTIVVLLLWIYIISMITLFGAHLCAAIPQDDHATTT
jgi:membrane protein